MFKPQYSGYRSKKIWDKIENLKDGHWLYMAFVLLQNMEETCLGWLNNEEMKQGE